VLPDRFAPSLPGGHHEAVPCRALLLAAALALTGGAVAWAWAGLPGSPAPCPAAGCDCEAAGPGRIRQPANAWSSLALAAAGTALLAASPSGRRHWSRRVAAAALTFAGIAAFLFHAGLTAWAARLDGLAVGVLLAALAVHRARGWARERESAGSHRNAGAILATLLPWLLLALGGVCWLLGRSDGPWCRPDSPLQAHAAWHLLAAAGIFLWMRRHSGDGTASPISPHPLASSREAGRP
jgi:dihydroceramidase